MLAIPEAIEILGVNGAEVTGTSGLMRHGDAVLEFAPGQYEILAFYRELWPLGDEHDTLRSDPALFDLRADPGGHYRLEYEHPQRYEEARRLAERFSGWIVNEADGSRVASRASGVQFARGLAGTIGSRAVVAIPDSSSSGPPAVSPMPAGAPPGTPLANLKEWWAQASPEERRAFLRWASQNP